MDANPTRQYHFRTGIWTAEQSVILATRHFLLNLKLTSSSFRSGTFAFSDGGTAFVEALEERPNSFGTLDLDCKRSEIPYSSANLQRLFCLENVLEQLGVGCLDDEDVLLPFSAKVKALKYEMNASDVLLDNPFGRCG